MFTGKQKAILERSDIQLVHLTAKEIDQIATRKVDATSLSNDQLIEFMRIANVLYRGGEGIVSDADYDFIFLAELRGRDPEHPFLSNVEPESGFEGKTVPLPERMLSTEKAYSWSEIEKWLERLRKAAVKVSLKEEIIQIKITPKLDGFAAYDDGELLYTRGDGRKGTDISRVFIRGLQVGGDRQRGQGAGEIVIDKRYFEAHLSSQFDNSRNFQAAILAEKKDDPLVQKAIDEGAAVFMPFAQLPSSTVTIQALTDGFDDLVNAIWHKTPFDVDGVILESINKDIKQVMGATRHHHRWQIAYKENTESVRVKVLEVKPQTSRSGRVNPVAILDPTRLSGAVISRATAHHYGMVKEKGIGPNAVIQLVRSGLVIPKIVDVVEAVKPQIPDTCPGCESDLVWDSDYLYCTNKQGCPAQIEHSLEHFFKLLGNIDGFGHKTIQKLHQNEINSVSQIYQLSAGEFVAMGFGEKTASNLVGELLRSRSEKIEDWRFLAAFGVLRLGGGNCERLLQHVAIDKIFELDVQQITDIEGFAEITARAIVKGLASIRNEYARLDALGFTLEETVKVSDLSISGSALEGKIIVFTGAMKHGSREEMKKQAKRLGAKVATSISGKTDLLVA
ncbi:MAG: helix-hairpin-helix domain-containing protein, partial [Gammaproteobacteria bacterium]